MPESSKPLPTIDLLEYEGLGLIVRWPSGVIYTNQVAGFGCEHPKVEGVLVPIRDPIGRPVLHALRSHFRGNWHPLTERDADIVDGVLHRNDLGFIVVDRSRLSDSREAWVWMNLSEDPRADSRSPVAHFGLREAVLTWPNSD